MTKILTMTNDDEIEPIYLNRPALFHIRSVLDTCKRKEAVVRMIAQCNWTALRYGRPREDFVKPFRQSSMHHISCAHVTETECNRMCGAFGQGVMTMDIHRLVASLLNTA
jgi:hypothetical protein